MTKPETFTDVIDAFGGTQALSERLGILHTTVRSWKHRKSIPPDYFPAIAKAAKRGSGINLEALHKMHKDKA